MPSATQPTSLRTFLIIWSGQVASVLGSEMTNFAITIWAWEQTGQATPLSFLFFFTYTPRIIAASFAGLIVDRSNRKQLMIVGDMVAGFSTIAILLLFLSNHLQIWHLYLTTALNGLFGYLQNLAFSASMAMIVPKQHYTRATAMSSYITYSGSYVIAPALAGLLYYAVGLTGILAIDLATFVIAMSAVLSVPIPQPVPDSNPRQSLWQQLTFGFRYLFKRPSLLAILVFWLSFNLVDTVSLALAPAMILARSGDNAAVLASVRSAIGVGGIIGGVGLSVWGGPQRRIHGLLLGTTLVSFSKMIIGLGRIPIHWMIAGFGTGIFAPSIDSSNQAIWLSKVEPSVQGRVFASRYLIAQITSPLGFAIAGPLADNVFEPAMTSNSRLSSLFGSIFGVGTGAGMALQYTIFCFGGALIGLCGYAFPSLRDVETIVPDYDTEQS
jgi:MFS transporter, DHA3 family, macrolide efflux protein